jgi:UDP-N-acetylmuramate--alanine ligase
MPGVSGALITDQLLQGHGGAGRQGDVQPAEGKIVHFVPSWSEVAPLVVRIARAGDLVLTVGAGDVTMIGPEILRLLGERPEAGAAAPGRDLT